MFRGLFYYYYFFFFFANFVLFCSFSSISLFEEFFEDEKSYVKCEASALHTLQTDNDRYEPVFADLSVWRDTREVPDGNKSYIMYVGGGGWKRGLVRFFKLW